jgi:predicted RNase H-like nuclease (RuvC/YqgF family)
LVSEEMLKRLRSEHDTLAELIEASLAAADTIEAQAAEIDRLQGYMDNAANTIRKLQDECDRWQEGVTKLCLMTGITWGQIVAAGMRVHIETED